MIDFLLMYGSKFIEEKLLQLLKWKTFECVRQQRLNLKNRICTQQILSPHR